jgi:hypothetical protein
MARGAPVPDAAGVGETGSTAAWLRSCLADNGGQAEAVDVLKAGDKVGFSKDTLKRVKTRAGVISRKDGMDAGWMWVLDPTNHHPPSPQRAEPGNADLAEESTKGAKGAASATPHPSRPSRSLPGTEHPDRRT